MFQIICNSGTWHHTQVDKMFFNCAIQEAILCTGTRARARTQPNPDAGGATTKSRQRALLRYAVARPPTPRLQFYKGPQTIMSGIL